MQDRETKIGQRVNRIMIDWWC